MRRSLVLIFFVCLVIRVTAQESVTQQTNPPSLIWYQINTPNFKILYSSEFAEEAQRVANTLDRIHDPEAATMGVRPRKIPIILQNQSSVSNAFVTLAPRRVEFYTMPSQNYNFIGTNDWLNLLSSHEYRHVVQFQRSITGFNKFFYYLFGQQAVAGFASAAAPQWFWEGDAVATETAFTHSGRGRIPNFNLLLRTNFLEGRTFNYHKQYLRSYKNNISNHYVLGYHMVSWLRKKTGDPDIWEKIAGRAWSAPFIPFTFSNAIKKETGMYVKDLFKAMSTDLTVQWKNEAAALTLTQSERVNPRSNTTYTDYLYPQILADGSIIAQKSGLGDIEQLVVLKDGGEEKRYVQGLVNESGMMSGASEKIVWNEFRFDPRWQVRTYSIVKGYDFKTNHATVVSTNSRYASAAISPDGQQVLTVETAKDYKTQLVVLDYASGKIVRSIPNPANDFIAMPRWTSDGNYIVALTTNKKGKTITKIEVGSGAAQDLLPRSEENIGYPVPFGKYVLYNSPFSNIDNIYALDTETGRRFQITSGKYGAYNPVVSLDGKSIYYNNQSRDGMDVVKIAFDPASWTPLEEVKKGEGFYQHLVDQEKRPGLLDSVPAKKYPVTRYHRASGMINPHSWGPYFTNTFAQAQFGIYSQDVLSTTSINGGYQYDINEKTGSFQAGVSYQGFFPIIDFQVTTGNRTQKTSVFQNDIKFNWRETGTSLGLRVPLVLTRSKYYTQVEFGNSVGLTQVSGYTNEVSRNGVLVSRGNGRVVPANDTLDYVFRQNVDHGALISNTFYINFSHSLKQALRDFNPKFGQFIDFAHYSTPYGGDFQGRLWVVRGVTYFPGLFKHHSLYFKAGYQTSPKTFDPNQYTFRNQLFKPRGYGYPNDHTFYTLSANYQLPVWYPDIAFGPVLNVQRIKANLFYDYGQGNGGNYFYNFNRNPARVYFSPNAIYGSTGIEMTFDINVMRLLQQLELGFRVTHINANPYNNSGVIFEFLIGNIPF